MRAMAFAQHGGAEVLQLMDLPKPAIDDDEVLVAGQGLRPQSPRCLGARRLAGEDSDAAHRRLRDDRRRRRGRQEGPGT